MGLVLAYSNDTPLIIEKLLREIRVIDPCIRSLSRNLDPQDKSLV
jgi:hypothetical protein